MSEPTNPPNANQELQFERAEYAAAGPQAATCAVCKQPIEGVYYTAAQKVVCVACHDGLTASQTGGSRTGRLGRALIFGLGAAIVGWLVWFAVRKITGYEVGIVAVVVGLFVGKAVRRGARGRGGLAYQLLAVFLTYSCIVANYIPDIFQELRRHAHEDDQIVETQPAAARQTTTARSAAAHSKPATSRPAALEHLTHMGIFGKVLLLLLLVLILFAFALALPILAGFQNIIGLLIIAFALWEAWKINRKIKINFAGPMMFW